MTDARGGLFVVSSPSGGGKGSILSRALQNDEGLRYSVSATTRPPRKAEVDGQAYHFLDRPTFESWIRAGRFVEWAEVHGHLYGSLRDELERLAGNGHDVLLELDVQGMRNMKKALPEVVSIFIRPPSFEELEQRLRNRGGLTEPELRTRMRNAREEMASAEEYDYVIVNDRLDDAVAEFESVIRREREKRAANADVRHG